MRLRTLIKSADLTPRKHAKLMKTLHQERAKHHAKTRVPRHFARNKWTTPGGPYRYEKRTNATIRIKKKKTGDPYRPNYVTGQMRKDILASSQTTATPRRWVWKARNPGFPLADWRRREIEELAREELADDILFYEREYAKRSKRPEYRRQRRKRVG